MRPQFYKSQYTISSLSLATYVDLFLQNFCVYNLIPESSNAITNLVLKFGQLHEGRTDSL